MSDIRRKFGQSIYKLRHQKQLSQMELAARADVHLNTVNLVEAGKKDVQLETIDCELSELFLAIENQRST